MLCGGWVFGVFGWFGVRAIGGCCVGWAVWGFEEDECFIFLVV